MPAAYSALLFDFDGVIVESVDVKTNAFRALFAQHPQHLPAITELHLRLGGVSRFRKFELIHSDILGLPLTEADRALLGERFSQLVLDQVVECPLVEGALALLQAEAPRRPLFVVTGTPDDEIGVILERRGLDRLFAEAHGSPRCKDDIIRSILSRHGWAPEQVLFIGDAMTDYTAAQATGVPFIGRVAAGEASPFPPGTVIVRDMQELAARLAAIEGCKN